MSAVAYAEATGRNAGFVSPEEQRRLRRGRVLVCGVGGMGGAAVQILARAGVGHLGLVDIDRFERSNLNRQLFADLRTLGRLKTEATRDGVQAIQPGATVELFGVGWIDGLDAILSRYPVVVNGMDDLRAGIQLYRKAREHGCTVLDAYTSPLPSVIVVRPEDPRPEERLGFPTVGIPVDQLDEGALRQAFLREISYVMAVAPTLSRIDPEVVAEIVSGERPRSSFAPTVVMAGTLMADEALNALLGRRTATDFRGYFFDPRAARVHRPRPGWWARLRATFARWSLAVRSEGGA